MASRKTLACMSVLALVLAGLVATEHRAAAQASPGQAAAAVTVTAITEPSSRRGFTFNGLGVIDKVNVKEGDVVKSGQVLMIQDREIEQIELDRLNAEATSQARVEFAEADLEFKKAVERRKTSGEAGVFSLAEQEEAKLDRISREKSLEIAKLDQSQNVLKAKQQEAKVVRMELRSRLDGIVEKIEAWEGEMTGADPSKPPIIVVKNDPMHIVIRDLTTQQVALLKLGDELEVKYPDEKNWQRAKISYIAPVADAGSNRQTIRLEMPNPNNRATGLEIQVKLPPKLAELMPGDRAAMNR